MKAKFGYYFSLNNYTLGDRLKMTPIDKIVINRRTDTQHTEIVFSNLTSSEYLLVEKVLAKKGKMVAYNPETLEIIG